MENELSPFYFDLLARVLRKEAGILLRPEKTYSLRAKLRPLANRWGFTHLNELITHVHRERHNPQVVDAVLNALTIKETRFFRDGRPFDLIRERILPHLARDRGERGLRIWSAACSNGQEAVSLAILLREALPPAQADRSLVVGTDVSEEAISRAREAVYTGEETQRGLPPAMRQRHFAPVSGGYRLLPEVRRLVRYRTLNLVAPVEFPLSRFDLILCRNVLIYLDEPSKGKALANVHSRLASDGYLLTGAGEDARRLHSGFQSESGDGIAWYRKVAGNLSAVPGEAGA